MRDSDTGGAVVMGYTDVRPWSGTLMTELMCLSSSTCPATHSAPCGVMSVRPSPRALAGQAVAPSLTEIRKDMTMSRARVIATQAVRHGPASRRLAQRRWLAGAAAVVALLTVGTSCSGTGESAANPVASSRAAAAPDPTERCGMSVPGEKVVMTAEDGVTIAAARFGTGPHGLVLVPQRANDLCGWARHIPALADSGLHVLAFDPRCTGYSDCPADDVGCDPGGRPG